MATTLINTTAQAVAQPMQQAAPGGPAQQQQQQQAPPKLTGNMQGLDQNMTNQSLYARITSLAAAHKDQELSTLLNNKKVADRLEAALDFYKLHQNGDADSIELAVGALQQQFAQKEALSESMKDRVLKPFAVACQLEAKTAFDLLDAYFMINHRKFYHFETVNQRITQFFNQINVQQQQPQQMFQGGMLQDREQKYQAFDDELKKIASKILSEVKQFYLLERRFLLKIYIVLLNSANKQQDSMVAYRRTAIGDFVNDKLLKKGLPVNLLKSLLRCQQSEKQEFRRYFNGDSDRGSREHLVLAIQEEKIDLLKLMFSLFFKDRELSDKDEVVSSTMQFLIQSCQIDYITRDSMSHLPQFSANASSIAGLTQLVSLAALQLHSRMNEQQKRPVVTKQSKCWNDILNQLHLSQMTGPIVLAIVQENLKLDPNNNQVKEMAELLKNEQDELSQCTVLVAINEILRSEVFKSDELQTMNDAFYLVIYGWLNKAYSFYDEYQMLNEVDLVQNFTLTVFGNRSIIQLIWSEIDDLECNIQDVSKQIPIFKKYLDKPTLNIQKFLLLMLVLSGNKREPKGTSVVEMLEKTKIKDGPVDSNLLAEMIAFLSSQNGPLENQHLDTEEFHMVECILKVFAKVIKQDPLQYTRLNHVYMGVAEMQQDGKLGMIFEQQAHLQKRQHHGYQGYRQSDIMEKGTHPFLCLLINCLHSLMAVDLDHSRRVVTHLVDALSALYDHDSLVLRAEIIFQLSSYVNQELGGSRIANYFGGVVLEAEASLRNYKATEAFLRFLCKCFKRPYPQECLDREGLLSIETSILAHALEQTYCKCVEEYFSLSYADTASMGNFTARILKLTRILLELFTDVPQSQKAPLCEPMPRFDLLLGYVTQVLNAVNVEQIAIRALDLAQSEERRPDGSITTSLENKWLNQASRQGHQHQVGRLIKMTNESLLLLNKLLELALVDDQPIDNLSSSHGQGNFMNGGNTNFVQDWTSKRCQHIRTLRCVQQLRSHVLEPQRALQSAQGSSYSHSVSLSLQSQIAHYSCPGPRLDSTITKRRALDHLTLTCKLWQNNLIESVRPDLYQLLQGLGSSSQLEAMFTRQLENAMSGNSETLPQCLAFLDLLIVAAQSQPRFLEMLLKYDSSKRQFLNQLARAFQNLIKNANQHQQQQDILEEQQRLHIKFKITALLSLMAKKRICIEFLLDFNEGEILGDLYNYVIEDECLKRIMHEKINLNGRYLEPIDRLDDGYQIAKHRFNIQVRKATNQCLAKVTICYFLQLLVSEYSRDPSNGTVRTLLSKIFKNEQFNTLSISNGQISSDVHALMNYMRNLNEVLQVSSDERNLDMQKQSHDMIFARGVRLNDQTDSSLHSKDGSVFLKGSLCFDLFKIMDKRRLDQFIVNPGSDLIEVMGNYGQLGNQFFVSTKELEYALQTEFYMNPTFIGQAVAISSEYNLALSVMLTDHLILKQKHDFFVSIGKITLRDSQMSVQKAEQLVPMSFLPLINKNAALGSSAGNQDQFKKDSTQLTIEMIKQAGRLLAQILQRKRNFALSEQAAQQTSSAMLPQNHFMTILDQDLLSQLVFTLGVISSQVSASKGSMHIEIRTDLEKLIQDEILTKMQSFINVDSCLFDTSLIAKEVQTYGDNQTASMHPTNATSAIQQSERNKYDMFIQLVTQCFQLSIRMKEDDQAMQNQGGRGGIGLQQRQSDQEKRAFSLKNQRIEDAYIKVLAQVLDGMRRNYCFLNGLKVFVLAVQLIHGDNLHGLSSLMKKQNDQPMKVIISKLIDKEASQEEITTILQLLINYAMSEEGAIHLSKLKILESLQKANIMQRLNDQDIYISKQLKNQKGQLSMQQIRNPSHVHWVQVLLLIRTMNEILLENPQVEHDQYFQDFVRQMHHFKQRIPKVLHIGLTMEAQATQQLDQLGNRTILSMGLLEEIELLCAIMQQLFEHGDLWAQLDYQAYSEFKDYTLFSIPKLLQHTSASAIIPASVTEQHLAKVNQSIVLNNQSNLLAGNQAPQGQSDREMNAFELKIEVILQKTFLSVTCSLLNCLLLSKKLVQQGKLQRMAGDDLLQTWQNQQMSRSAAQGQHNFSQSAPSQSNMHQSTVAPHMHKQFTPMISGVFADGWMSSIQAQGSSVIAVAFEVVRACQASMMRRYASLKTLHDKQEVQDLYKYVQNIFQHDEWIQKEYSGGLNAHMLADSSLEEVLEIAETALQVSGQVSALLLEKVRDSTSIDIRFANGTHHLAPISGQTDEQQVVFMSNDLMTYLKETVRECKKDGLHPQSSSDNIIFSNQNDDSRLTKQATLDDQYLDKLQDFVKRVKADPCVGGAQNHNNFFSNQQNSHFQHY